MNVGELRDLALKLVNDYSADGQVLPTPDTADFRLAIVDFLNVAYYKAIEFSKIEAVHRITHNPVPNLLHKYDSFDMLQHLDEDIMVEATGAKSYYFEIDGEATVYVEERIGDTWTVLDTITVPNTVSGFTAYRGLITASDPANSIRIRFSGDYPYNIRNRALYGYTFPSAEKVPPYQPYVYYKLPDDYISLNKIVRNDDERLHENLTNYYIEGEYLVINYFYTGSFDVHYYRRPDPLEDDEDVPEIKPQHHRYLAFFAAGQWLIANGQQATGIVRLNEWDAFMNEMSPNLDEAGTGIANTSGW